jgi:predicted nuclease of predicted toxin-antitoxin system
VVAIQLVLDQGLPRDAAAELRQLGYICTHVGEIEMAKASDVDIIAWALQNCATVVTLDADFHHILAVSGAKLPSVIRLRMQGLGTAAVVDIVQKAIKTFEAELNEGALVTVKSKKMTCHKLPIGNSE